MAPGAGKISKFGAKFKISIRNFEKKMVKIF